MISERMAGRGVREDAGRITDAMVEAAAKAEVEWESDECERRTDGGATLDRWDALTEEAREEFRQSNRASLAAALAAATPDERGTAHCCRYYSLSGPCNMNEWNALTQEERDEIVASRCERCGGAAPPVTGEDKG